MSEFDESNLEQSGNWSSDSDDNHSVAGRARVRAQLQADIEAFLQGGARSRKWTQASGLTHRARWTWVLTTAPSEFLSANSLQQQGGRRAVVLLFVTVLSSVPGRLVWGPAPGGFRGV